MARSRNTHVVFFRTGSSFSKWVSSELSRRCPRYFGDSKPRTKREREDRERKRLKGKELKEAITLRKAIRDYIQWCDRIMWVMTEGNPTGRRDLLRMDFFEFFEYMEVHEQIIEKRLRKLEENQAKHKK